ncbi:MAG TPA: hypothetical protein VJ276_25570 [Thermoanaerobaculia bacterium]|nr:hypothetical protein [Thermoanaerobaculia bacterium]
MSNIVDLSSIHAHLNRIGHDLDVVNTNVGAVSEQVVAVYRQQELTKDRLDDLHQQFQEFVAADRKDKQKQYAATELVRVRQEIEQKFGHHEIVRRTTTGILQATDIQMIRQNTIHTVTEQLMVTTPNYWLAPALVALSAWVKDDRALAERGVAEAIRRDDNKTSLFFALVCRRGRRSEALTRWLSRYFQMQNPMAIDREVVVMLDGLANGVFGGAALVACSGVIEQWLAELEEQAGFLDDQRKRWAAQLDVMTPKPADREYPTLRKYAGNAPQLLKALCAARRNRVVHDFFSTLFTGELIVPPSIEAACDALLDSLVANYDDEELPFRREERLLALIKEDDGDRDVAKARFDAEAEIHEASTNFAAVLTNSAMHPEQLGATRATQRYAVSRSREWIMAAHNDLVARDRMDVPRQAQLTVASWSGTSADGANEKVLAGDLRRHYDAKIESAVNAVSLTPAAWIVLIAGVLIGGLIMTGGGTAIAVGLVLIAAAAAFFYWKYNNLDRQRGEARQALQTEHDQAASVLKAALAELADYRREVAVEDARSADVTTLLESLSSPQFVLQRPEQRVSVA